MEILREILLFLHLIGMAIIIGSYFAFIRTPRVAPGMLHGAYLQLATGLLLVAVLEMGDGDVNHMKIGIKLLLAILTAVFAFIGVRQDKKAAQLVGAGAPAEAPTGPRPSATMAHLSFASAVLAVLVAVFV
ncbi:hypothetical protein GCM10022261_25930 [Brevibacterium daeguense]|uniref:Integral membrane protein n=1 Tax=Brevibacterium daeguense TaxID=909936 RepID=A0ABP8EM92_9MICO|nr:hypothetical protein [Brevibacterium daeguense]